MKTKKKRPIFNVLPINFTNDEATKRVVQHAVKRVIEKHREERQKLANR
jgi:hypothetical protein